MGFVMAIALAAIAGRIALFVIGRLKHKYNQGNVGNKKSKSAQDLLGSLIPIGMLFGCVVGVIFGIFSPVSLVLTVSLGANIGYLFGYFAYEFYSKKKAYS
ncbi:hypothetical protein ACDX78_03740 [Virgibacillus oceani]